jgi:hypothetical protein
MAAFLLTPLLLLSGPGCATLTGVPISPATGAVGGVVHSRAEGWDRLWLWPVGFGLGAVAGPLMAVSIGISADTGFVSNGGYGLAGDPEFADVFDPYGYCLEPDSEDRR